MSEPLSEKRAGGWDPDLFRRLLPAALLADATCGVCQMVVRDAVELGCREAHLVCEACLQELRGKDEDTKADTVTCPRCGGAVGVRWQPSGYWRKYVAKFKIFCPHARHAHCSWTGTVLELETHLGECSGDKRVCPYREFGCVFECKDGIELAAHLASGGEVATHLKQVADVVKALKDEIAQLREANAASVVSVSDHAVSFGRSQAPRGAEQAVTAEPGNASGSFSWGFSAVDVSAVDWGGEGIGSGSGAVIAAEGEEAVPRSGSNDVFGSFVRSMQTQVASAARVGGAVPGVVSGPPGSGLQPIIDLPYTVELNGHEGETLVSHHPFKRLYVWGKDVTGSPEWRHRASKSEVQLWRAEVGDKVRLTVREAQSLVLRANHYVSTIQNLKAKDVTSWMWTAVDASIDSGYLSTFAVRFQNAEDGQAFKNKLDELLNKQETQPVA